MAGEKHHTIQKLLLKGFSSKVEGKAVFAWHFCKGAKPIEASVKSLTVIRHFYGKAGSLNADDAITDFEGREITPLIQWLRSLDRTQEVSDTRIARFVAHWMVRTSALRKKGAASADYLMDALRDQISTPQGLDKVFPGMGAFSNDLNPILKQYFETMKKRNPGAARESQVKNLAQNVSPPLRVEGLQSLRWTLQLLAERVLIVGDVGPLAQIAGQTAFKSLTDKGDIVERVFVPISADRLLVGSVSSVEAKADDINELNSQFASHSVEEFIAASCTDRELRYHALLGSTQHMIPSANIDEIAAAAIEECRNKS